LILKNCSKTGLKPVTACGFAVLFKLLGSLQIGLTLASIFAPEEGFEPSDITSPFLTQDTKQTKKLNLTNLCILLLDVF
jgi:hypothetical protein